MKQKFTISKDIKTEQLIIEEFAELEKETQSLLCKEFYSLQKIETAVQMGRDALIRALRTNNLYPPAIYIDQIAQSVEALVQSKEQGAEDLFFNDIDLMGIPLDGNPLDDIHDVDSDDVDDLLDDDIDESLDKGIEIKSLKIADDEMVEADDI